MTRYQHLANLLAERIEQGLYRHGEKLPSVRSLSQEHGVSISTVQQAYQTLEQLRLITPQPRSGYFVAPQKAQPPVPLMSRPVQRPVEITQWDQVLDMLAGHADKSIIPLAVACPISINPA
jgi:DNA-binding GntR family transcriptional regulator